MNNFEETGENVEAAALPDNQSQAEQTTEQEQMVPVSALQAERRERQQLQEQQKLLQDHLQLLQANMEKSSSTKKEDEFEGLTDNDVLTVGEAKKFMNQYSQQQSLQIEELKMVQSHPDYNEVVRKYLPEVLKNEPETKDLIQRASNPYKAAYFLAKRSDAYLKDQGEKSRSPEAQKAESNLSQAGSLSQVGSGVSSMPGQTYKAMSDDDFRKLVNKNLGYA